MEQFRNLLELLDARPEGDGTMLDNSIFVLCSEVADGKTHQHHDLPILVAGHGGGALRTGRFLDLEHRSHGDL